MFLTERWFIQPAGTRQGLVVNLAASEPTPDDLEDPDDAHAGEVRGIYRDIHDRVAGDVSVAFRNLELYEVYCEREPDKAHLQILQARQALDEARKSIRAIVEGNVPSDDIGGLEKALRAFARSVRPEDMLLSIAVGGDEARVPAPVRTEAFIVIREALRNALRHSRARNLSVNVDISGNELRATVEDDGRGFDLRHVTEKPSGIGVSSMRERATRLRGNLLLSTRPGAGTRIELVLPM
jgi:signal transduction histidine kinase